MMRSSSILWLMIPLSAFAQRAAQPAAPPPPPPPTGVVVGNTVCDDTQRPARFADVYLVPDPGVAAADPQDRNATVLHFVQVRTGVDGGFRAEGVPAGTYYAVGLFPGYVTPLTPVPSAHHYNTWTPDQIRQALSQFQTIRVEANQTAQLSLTLHRGATIAGRVRFEDGQPVVKQQVDFRNDDAAQGDTYSLPIGLGQIFYSQRSTQTDDEGRFRLLGMPPGKYLVSASLEPEQQQVMQGTIDRVHYGPSFGRNRFTVYAPGVFRRSEARRVEIKGGETVNDADIELRLTGLHRVTGNVLAGEDRHPLQHGDIYIESVNKDDGVNRSTSTNEDGSFALEFVPDGQYLMSVGGVEQDPNPQGNYPRITLRYPVEKRSIAVAGTDVSVGEVDLKPKPPEEKNTAAKP